MDLSLQAPRGPQRTLLERMGRMCVVVPAVLVCCWLPMAPAAAAQEAPPETAAVAPAAVAVSTDFDRDVLPIFQATCVRCHGSDKQKAGMRLDSKAAALRGGERGPVLLPGNPGGSRLLRIVRGEDPDLVMPPKGERLTEEQIALIEAWITEEPPLAPAPTSAAAPDAGPEPYVPVQSEHWAFRSIVRPEVPAVAPASAASNPIDAFILARLEREGLEPSPEADRTTLIRRLSLDLVGLPPTPEDVDAFVADENPYAYDRLVNRLLASPHFGERWGRHWLDLARYADSDGFEADAVRPNAWRYRDWVIDAFNRDMPYDQFVTEQLAGDLLPGAGTEEQVATGFHRNTLTNLEGGVDQEQYRVEQIVDRTNTTGSTLLGLTYGCAQCHNHKYDPLTQREYYGLFAFFNTGVEKDIRAPTQGELIQYKRDKAAWDKTHADLTKDAAEYTPKLMARLAADLPGWEARHVKRDPDWTVLKPTTMESDAGSSFQALDDGSILVAGTPGATDRYTIETVAGRDTLTGIRLEVLTDASLPSGGPGRAAGGLFSLSELAVRAGQSTDAGPASRIRIDDALCDDSRQGFPVEFAIDGKLDTGWAIKPLEQGETVRTAVFIAGESAAVAAGTPLTFTLSFNAGAFSLGRFRLSASTAPDESLRRPDAVRKALQLEPAKRSPAAQREILDYLASFDARGRALQSALEGHRLAMPKPPNTLAQTLVENSNPPTTHVLTRGDFLRPGDAVLPHTPAVLPPLHPRGTVPDRLDLARWLFQPDNPLTARVAVNRLWEHLMGRGLVFTSEDFGTRGDPPSHPELLDWLASESMARGWSTKEMIRLVVHSATYRQSSKVRPELQEKDPLNVLLARQGRFRVEAEITRDLALSASGLLNPAVGGPSIRPPQPPEIAKLGYNDAIKWEADTGLDKFRRGLYVFFQRTVPYPMLMTFDCPDSNVTCIRRAHSNTPLQALTLLNDPVFVECAIGLGRRLWMEGLSDQTARVTRAFRLCLGRQPTLPEIDTLVTLMHEREEGGEAAGVPAPAPDDGTPVRSEPSQDRAGDLAMARVLLNLDEFVTRE